MPKLTPEMQDDLAYHRCVECQEGLVFQMDSDCNVALCCGSMYTTPLLRGDLVSAVDESGEEYYD